MLLESDQEGGWKVDAWEVGQNSSQQSAAKCCSHVNCVCLAVALKKAKTTWCGAWFLNTAGSSCQFMLLPVARQTTYSQRSHCETKGITRSNHLGNQNGKSIAGTSFRNTINKKNSLLSSKTFDDRTGTTTATKTTNL